MSESNVAQSAPKSSTPKGKAKLTTLPETMESALYSMNAEFCLIEHLPAIVRVPTLDDPDLHVYSRSEFTSLICADRIINGHNVASEWLKWPKKNKLKSMTYAPGQPLILKNQLNTWIPSQVKPIKGDLSLWFTYLDHLFTSDPTFKDWFICWLAYQFQFPGVKLHSASVFWSPETGTGKSLFGYIMSELFGAHNFSEINESELHGAFNFWCARKMFIMGEEIKGSNAQKFNDFLKSLITRRYASINTKNTPQYTLPDTANYFFTSNRENAFFLDETDRRFFVHRLSDKKLDANYVKNTFIPWLENGGYSAILYWLLNDVDLSANLTSTGHPFNPFGAAPQTSARKEMILTGRDEVETWLASIVEDDSTTFLTTSGWKLATAEDLLAHYSNLHPRSRITSKTFTGFVRKAFPMIRGGNTVKLDPNEPAKRVYCPPSAFAGYQGTDLATIISSYEVGRI